ncbi:MAG: autotransporter domain-containing protein, partial [Desulfobacterales bacterium]|nr:autotransporter domain-containing protein [Desulfobacterales bacterium]
MVRSKFTIHLHALLLQKQFKVIVVLLFFGFLPHIIHAQTTFTFQGTADNVFTNSANWSGGNAPPADVAGGFLDIASGNGASPFNITNVDLTYININGFTTTAAGTDGDYTFTGAGSFSFQTGGFITNDKTGTTTISVPVIGAGTTLTTNAINGDLVFTGTFALPSTTLTVQGGSLTDFQGVISGSGNILSNSGGDINLRAANTFTGGVVSTGTANFGLFTNTSFGTGDVSVSTLSSSFSNESGGDLTIANNIAITGVTFTDESTGSISTTLSGVISGTGSFAKNGTATTVLSGVNTYTGGTTLSGGEVFFGSSSAFGTGDITISGSTTLEPVGANLTVANDIAIASGQTLSVDSSTNRPFFLTGVISGDGAFAAQNQATFTFSGANTYTGGTTLDNAEIFIGNDTAFGTGDITITSGSDFSATVDGINVANNIDLDNSLGLSLEGSNDFTLSGNITGTTGGVFNINSGISTLAGTNTIPGEVRVSTGTVSITGSTTADEINSFGNGVLAGTGTIISDVTIFGRVSSGATGRGSVGSLSITGSLDFGTGIYDMEIASTAGAGTGNDVIEITGNIVDLSGFLLVTPLDTYTPAVGDSFTVMTSTTGIPGLFPSAISLLPAMFTIEQEVVGNSLIVNVLAEDIANVVTARNLVFAAQAFERIRNNSPTGDLADVIDQLETLNTQQLITAFEQIVPNYLVTQSQATYKGIDVQNNNITGRIGELRYGTPASFSNNLSLKTPYDWTNPVDPEEQYIIALQNSQLLEQQQEIFRFGGAKKGLWSSWISGFGTFGDFNPALSQAGYEFTTAGVTFGFDYRILDTLAAGAFAGYSNTGTTVDGGQGSNYANTVNSGIYMTWFNEEGFYASGLIGGGVNFYENNRRIVFGDIDRVAESSTTGFYFQSLATGGYQFKFKDFA